LSFCIFENNPNLKFMKKPLVFFFAVCSSFIGFSQQLSWTPIADFSNGPRYAPFSFMVGNDFYTGTGLSSLSPQVAADDLYKYDSINDSWVAEAVIPASLEIYGTSPFVINGKAYICDGQVGSGYNIGLWQYDPTGNSWAAMAPFPGIPGYTATSFSIGPYGFMGLSYSPYMNSFWRYNSLTNVWDTIPPFPGYERQSASSFVINGVAYVGLGNDQDVTGISFTDFYKYDTLSGNWSQVATFPGSSRRDCSSFVLNGKGYIIGGIDSTSTYINNEVWEYDPLADTWSQMDTFPQSIRVGSYASNGSNYAITGMGQKNDMTLSNKMWKTATVATSVSNVDQNPFKVWCSHNTVHLSIQQPLSDIAVFRLYDISGKEVSNNILAKGQTLFDFTFDQFASGMYIYNISNTENNISHNGKITLNN
jgi:N-acetylneuraminic acid mutarotase